MTHRTFTLYWILGAIFAASQTGWCIEVQVAEAPVNNLELTVGAIKSAKKNLFLNIYELSSQEIANALINRIEAGVHVEILEEAQPVGGMSKEAKKMASEIVKAMERSGSDNHFFEMTSKTPSASKKAPSKRRFRFDHAKYAVIDQKALLIGSENYSETGNPLPGNIGNRGWEVLIHDVALAREFLAVFQEDADTSQGDVQDLIEASHLSRRRVQTIDSDSILATTRIPTLDAKAVKKITSPDTSLSGLVSLIRSSKRTLDIEQMTFDPGWGKESDRSKLLAEVLAAAKRGVQVRILVNDETVFDHPSHPSKPKNRETVALVKKAEKSGLPIQARIANIKAMGVDYIHNKGVLADGDKTLISSINWGQNSVENNREAAVLLLSPAIYNHYEALFEADWKASGGR